MFMPNYNPAEMLALDGLIQRIEALEAANADNTEYNEEVDEFNRGIEDLHNAINERLDALEAAVFAEDSDEPKFSVSIHDIPETETAFGSVVIDAPKHQGQIEVHGLEVGSPGKTRDTRDLAERIVYLLNKYGR